MSPETLLAKYKEASVRADETIEALQRSVQLQDTVISMMQAELNRLQQLVAELRAAL